MAKLIPISLCLKALPEGGFAVADAPYDGAPVHWLAAFSTIDEALRFIRNKMLPAPRPISDYPVYDPTRSSTW